MREIIQASGKMIFLDKFLPKMRQENKKVIFKMAIFTIISI